MGVRRRRFTAAVAVVAILMAAAVLTWKWTNDQEHGAEAREAAVALVEANTAIGRLPDDLSARQHEVESHRKSRLRALEQVWAGDVVVAQAAEWEHALDLAARDGAYEGYYDNRLTVTEWQTVRQTRDGALVTFKGHMEYLGSQWDGWRKSALTAYRVHLRHRGSAGWQLVSVDTDQLVAS